MAHEESGVVVAMSMVLTAIVKALPPDVAKQAARELRAARLDARSRAKEDGAPAETAQACDKLAGMYLDALKQVAAGSAQLVGGKLKK